jgi:tetratricopeptide (TPR) repeat protein/WD40 repeat protein
VWVGTDAGGVWLWDGAGSSPQQWLYEARGPVRDLALSPAGDLSLVISENVQSGRPEARLWDLHRGQWLGIALPYEAGPARAAFGPDGRRLLTWDPRRPARVWDLDCDRRWTGAVPVPAPMGGLAARSLLYRPDGSLLTLAVGSQAASMAAWDPGGGAPQGQTIQPGVQIHAAALSPDGRTTLLATMREARFWDNTTGKWAKPRVTYDQAVRHVCFSPDGTTAALATPQRLWLVDVASGNTTGPTFPAPGTLTDLRFSPDGKGLWLTTPATVRCLDVTSGREAAPGLVVRGRGFQAVVPAPEGRLLAVLDNTGVAVWDTATGGRADVSIPRSPGPGAITFSPDGTALLTADPTGAGAQLWDLRFGRPVGLPIRCPPRFSSGAFRPDGRALAVKGMGGVVRLERLADPVGGTPSEVGRRAQALTGLTLTAAGDARGLAAADWQAPAAAAGGGDEAPPALAWHLRRGLDRVEVEQWPAAVWQLDRQLRERPDDWLALALRARALAQLNRLDEAAADFDRSFEKGPPETVFAWHLLAAQGATLYPPDPPAGKPRWVPAPVWFMNRLIARGSPESVALLVQRARGQRPRRWDLALADFERAARLAPNNASLLLEVARACAEHKQPEPAVEYFVKAAAAAPDDAAVWFDTARELARLERWDRAAEHFLRAKDLQPAEHGVGADRSVTCLELARSPQAFDRAARLRPKDADLWTGRARYDVERAAWKEAADDFARAAELAPADERSYELAAVLLILGDEAGYRKVVTRMIDQIDDTSDPFLAYTLARACALSPKPVVEPARAVGWAEQARAASPEKAWFLHALGLALYRKGDYEAAAARLKESEKSGWSPVLNWLVLAMAEHRLGHADEARKYLDRATDYLDNRPPARPFTAVLFSTDAEEAQLLRREADDLIRGKDKSH